MSEQLDLLTHARDTDPWTSHAAAQAVDLNKQCRIVLDAIYAMRFTNSTFTDGELADHIGEERGIVARRRKDLGNRGLVEPVWFGMEQEARVGRRGRSELVWRLSEAGWVEAQAKS